MINSLKKNGVGIFLMFISAILVCIGQLFWKLSGSVNITFLSIGFLCYGVGALVMIIAYKFGSLSVLQPMLSLNYIINVFLAKFILNEQITSNKIIGILIILIGIILIGGGDD